MPVIPRTRSLSQISLSPQGRRCVSSFFRTRPPLPRAVPAKPTRNNRSASPPYRKNQQLRLYPPLRHADPERPEANEA